MVMLHWMRATAGAAFLTAAAALPAQDIEPAASTPSSSPDSRTLSLADLGYPEGLSLTQPAGLTTIYFPAPIDASVRDAKIVLMLTGGSLAEQGAYVQLRVNGQTRRVVPLAGNELDRGIEYVLPLTAADFGERFLALGLNHRFDPRRQYCGEQDSGTFLNISPRSYFSYELAGDRPASLRGWLSTLPAKVVLGVSGDSPTTLKSAWFAAHELRRRGRQVRFVTGAGPGAHILVGEASTPVFAGVTDAAAGPPLRLVERNGARILGIAALMGEIVVTNRVVRREIPLAIGSMVVFVPVAWLGLGPITGIILLVLLVASIVVLLRWSRHVSMKLEIGEHRVVPEAVRALLGLIGAIAGAQLLVVNAAALATDFRVPQLVIGFTLIALGTSLPELVTTIQAMRRRETDLVVGNLFGSNLFNSLAGGGAIGVMSTLAPAGIGRAQLSLLVAMVGAGALAWLLLGRRLRITRLEGVILLVAYVLSIPLLL